MVFIFGTRVPWLGKEEEKSGNERRPRAKEGSTERVCGAKFFSLAFIQVIELHWKEPS